MANTTFIDKQTIIQASWLNSINRLKYDIFDGAETKIEACKAIGAIRVEGEPEDGQVPVWEAENERWIPGDATPPTNNFWFYNEPSVTLTEVHRNGIIEINNGNPDLTTEISIDGPGFKAGDTLTIYKRNHGGFTIERGNSNLVQSIKSGTLLSSVVESADGYAIVTVTCIYSNFGRYEFYVSGDTKDRMSNSVDNPLILQGSDSNAASIIFKDFYGGSMALILSYPNCLSIHKVDDATNQIQDVVHQFWDTGSTTSFGPEADWIVEPTGV